MTWLQVKFCAYLLAVSTSYCHCRTIEFKLWNDPSDLKIIQTTCFPTSNSSDYGTNQILKTHNLTLPDNILPATIAEIKTICPELSKTFKIDGIRVYQVVTELDKIMIPVTVFLCLVLFVMVFFQEFRVYGKIGNWQILEPSEINVTERASQSESQSSSENIDNTTNKPSPARRASLASVTSIGLNEDGATLHFGHLTSGISSASGSHTILHQVDSDNDSDFNKGSSSRSKKSKTGRGKLAKLVSKADNSVNPQEWVPDKS